LFFTQAAVPEDQISNPPTTSTSELVDVVYLVMQAIWADMRRSRRAIEPSQWATLRKIARGPCTMSELARHKGVSLPTISKSVDMLVRRAWVERFVDDTDRRQTLVRLTSGGRRVLAECRRRVELRLDEKLATLTPAEREQVTASLRTVRDALVAED
jgi:DNA-binding MarR family transcriptional regulator